MGDHEPGGDLFRLALEASPAAMILVDAAGSVALANARAAALFGYRPEELIGSAVDRLAGQRFQAGHPVLRRAFLDEPQARPMGTGRELFARRRDGSEFPVEVGLTPLRTPAGSFVLCAVVDLSDRRQAERRTEELRQKLAGTEARLADCLVTDGLTGLRNRRALMEQLGLELQRALRSGRSLSLVLFDLDRFKRYNDRFGHQAGDEVLRRVAALLRTRCRASDVFGRYAAKEFGVILPDTDQGGARVLAERLRQAVLEEHWPFQAVTASFGVATFLPARAGQRPPERCLTRLLADCDEALSRAKQAGRNQVLHAADLEKE